MPELRLVQSTLRQHLLSLARAEVFAQFNNEELYFDKIGPNYVGWAVIEGIIIKEMCKVLLLISKHKNTN